MKPVTDARPDRSDIEDALRHIGRSRTESVSVRYAEMWLREAAAAESSHDEARHLAKAEQQLGRALLASASPSLDLSLAYTLTQRARSEATD